MKRIGIIGGTGYTGAELLRILSVHPGARVTLVTSRERNGAAVGDVFPSLRGVLDLRFTDPAGADFTSCAAVFCAAPHGVAMTHAQRVLDAGAVFLDLSADFRLRDAGQWQHWYGRPHVCPKLLDKAVYGLPEVNRAQIRNARLVALPGCYPTAVQLGFLPLLKEGLAEPRGLIADAKSGVSGAGRRAEAEYNLCETAESFKAYALGGHRHLPEIVQGLREAAGTEVELLFVPHLAPMIRGIHATLYAKLHADAPGELQKIYQDFYRDEPFVDVMPAGACPDTRSVRGSNMCRIAVHRPNGGGTAVILAVEDNLVKGAAGQAVQAMNLALGMDETAGLQSPAMTP